MFDEQTATRVAAYFLDRAGGRKNYTSLIKLMYIADRQSYIDYCEPITGDRVVAMSKGPVLSNVYDLIKGRRIGKAWNGLIERCIYDVRLIADVPQNAVSWLPEAIVDILDRVFAEHGSKTYGQLIDYTHEFTEWIEAIHMNGYNDIMPKDILVAVGKTPAEIEKALKRLKALNELDFLAKERFTA